MTLRTTVTATAFACLTAVGCSSGSTDQAQVVDRTTTTTTTTPVWQPPVAGVYVPVAEIPPPSALRDNTASMWMIVAQVCREYDAAHGTTTRITVEAVPESPNGRPASDTACIPPHDAGPGGSANAL